MALAMLCTNIKNSKNCGNGASSKIKAKLACILVATESTRLRMGETLPTHHEDHITGKGENSQQHYNFVHKFIPMPQAVKISAWNLTKVKSKKEVIDEARTSGVTVLLHH